jgi:hypothetical protein
LHVAQNEVANQHYNAAAFKTFALAASNYAWFYTLYPRSYLPAGRYGQLDALPVHAARPDHRPSVGRLGQRGASIPSRHEIEGVIRLPFAPRRGFAQALRKRALQLCPARIVDRSWAVSLNLTRVQLPSSARIVFLAKTSTGWTAWYHS